MVYFLSERLGKAYKFSRPFHGPYQVVKAFPNGIEVSNVGDNKAEVIRVAFSQVIRCPKELGANLEDLLVDGPESMYEGDAMGDNSTKRAEGRKESTPEKLEVLPMRM